MITPNSSVPPNFCYCGISGLFAGSGECEGKEAARQCDKRQAAAIGAVTFRQGFEAVKARACLIGADPARRP
jgi:hypothetical protein